MSTQRRHVTPERPVALHTAIHPEYLNTGICIENGYVVLCSAGTATTEINFRGFPQRAGAVNLLFPGDVNMIRDASPDLGVEYLAFTPDIMHEAMIGVPSPATIMKHRFLDAPAITAMTRALFASIRTSTCFGRAEDMRRIAVLQIRAFFDAYCTYLASRGLRESTFSSRGAELFARFMALLTRHYRESRSVSFYADKMDMTPRYLTGVVTAMTGKSAKYAIDEYAVMQMKLALQDDTRSINDIAWEFHFSGPAYFSNYFKQHTSISPQHYRAHYGEEK